MIQIWQSSRLISGACCSLYNEQGSADVVVVRLVEESTVLLGERIMNVSEVASFSLFLDSLEAFRTSDHH
jgi:hypothetical protein